MISFLRVSRPKFCKYYISRWPHALINLFNYFKDLNFLRHNNNNNNEIIIIIIITEKVLSYLMLNWALHYEHVWGSGSIAPFILNFDIRWKWAVCFTLRPLYPQGEASEEFCEWWHRTHLQRLTAELIVHSCFIHKHVCSMTPWFMCDLSFNEMAVGSRELCAAFAEHPPESAGNAYTGPPTCFARPQHLLLLLLALR